MAEKKPPITATDEEQNSPKSEEKEKNHNPEEKEDGDDAGDEEDSVLFQTENDGCDNQFDDSNNDADHEVKEQINSITTDITPAQKSTDWKTQCDALETYVQQHGHPPQTREENPPLYDWLRLQKARQSYIENLCNSC
mmetsp:Transcript_7089/g.16105  ORF Transcript_7089/g.16105 Transcript_7089/m.16105 type:complete len:138 (-) Transcript_7089:1947-2360(-)